MVSKDDVYEGFVAFLHEDIEPKLSGMNVFALNFILPSLRKKYDQLYHQLASDDLFSDLMTENTVDIDNARDRAREALKATGGKLKLRILGTEIALDDTDFDKICSLIKSK